MNSLSGTVYKGSQLRDGHSWFALLYQNANDRNQVACTVLEGRGWELASTSGRGIFLIKHLQYVAVLAIRHSREEILHSVHVVVGTSAPADRLQQKRDSATWAVTRGQPFTKQMPKEHANNVTSLTRSLLGQARAWLCLYLLWASLMCLFKCIKFINKSTRLSLEILNLLLGPCVVSVFTENLLCAKCHDNPLFHLAL